MSLAARRRVGIAGLLGLLAGALVFMLAPANPGALRLAGVGLLWWYAALAAPVAAVLLVVGVQRASPRVASGPTGAAALTVAAWTSPVILALVAARVFSGAADAPALALAVLVAPLIAFLGPTTSGEPRPNPVAALGIGAGVGLILWANLLLLADVGGMLGLPRWAASLVAAVLVLLAVASRRDGEPVRRSGLVLLYGSASGFLVLVAVVGLALAASPWAAWRDVASRPALRFGEHNPWVTEGRTLAAPTALEFVEAHRVTALSAGTYRVLEAGRVREWPLRAGESLSLRPGDRLVLAAGTRLKFEAGKRVPGTPASGVVWADPPDRGAPATVADTLGAAVTLVGGALVLVGPGRALSARRVYAGSGLLVTLVLGALCLGVYGAHAAPGLAIGAPALAAVFDLPAAVLPGALGKALVVPSAVVLLLLAAATALALREVLRRALGEARAEDAAGTRPRRPLAGLTTTALLVAAGLASMWPGDASWALLAGFGLTASVAVAPRLAGESGEARLLGSVVGVIAFAGLVALGPRVPAWAGAAVTYPALVAAPLAWAAARGESARRARRARR